ncbi:MAG: TonB-dependent receptor [Hydrotalea flava]|nr:TonB-dependent receptor [Hydrotalea flava]RWZ88931.1 MAG: TonB-dependent receptor [Hydrotalea sp. AMD]NIM37185.1 TonB-dependent receptor [Hydrotalea flava]NIN02378.1 TonB-dependent receptor [Hydrotalea flava]NIN14030.1 TonB-dependent receptor [Hydrotalea flava]
MSGSAGYTQSTMSGTVLDAVTKQALQGATITDFANHHIYLTDANGNFSIPTKTDSISVTCIGYYPKKIKTTNQGRILLTPSFSNLNEIIISGSRETQKRTEVPVAINVISKTQINDTKATRLDMLINKVPGVFMVDLGNEQHSMAVRQPIGTSNIFLYLEDGIPIRTVGDFNHNALIEINQASLQRIEVIKGPASSLYGSDAVGGALNFITQSPSPYLTGKIQAEIGSLGYKRTDVAVSNTYKKISIYAAGYYANQNQSVNEHNDFYKAAFTVRGDYTFNKKSKLINVLDLIHYKTDQKGGLDSQHFYRKDYSSFYRFTYRKVDALRFRSTLNQEWNDNNQTSFTIFYRNSSIGQNPFYAIKNVTGNSLKANGQINVDAFQSFGTLVQHTTQIPSVQIKWISGIGADYSPAIYLAKYINIDKDANGVFYQYHLSDSVLTDYKIGLFNTALYTQIEYQPVHTLRLVAAARYDRLDYNFDNHLPPGAYSGAPDAVNHFDHFSPKLGLTYNFGNQKGIYLNYSVGFAPPNITDLYSGVLIPTLQPSSYNNYEIGGWLGFAGSKGSVEASLYKLNGKNEIVSVRLQDGSYQKQNTGITSHKGIELNIKYAPTQELMFRIGGTVAKHKYINYLQQGKDFSGNDMPQAPAYIINGEITYKPLFVRGFRIAAECQSLGSYFTDPQNTSKYNGFTAFNIRMGYRLKNYETWMNCLNVANGNYAVTVEKSAYGTSYRSGQLRTLQVGVAYHFDKNKN